MDGQEEAAICLRQEMLQGEGEGRVEGVGLGWGAGAQLEWAGGPGCPEVG